MPAGGAMLSVLLLAVPALGASPAGCYAAAGVSKEDYPRCTELAEGKLWMAWRIEEAQGKIELALARRGHGWMAVGIGEEGSSSMKGADVVAVHQSAGADATVAEDMFAVGFERPRVDESQDVELMSSGATDGFARAVVRRPLRSCDEEDRAIRVSYPHPVLFAYGAEGEMRIMYHSTTRRGVKFVNFYEEDLLARVGGTPEIPEGSETLSVSFDGYKVPTSERRNEIGEMASGENQFKCFAVPMRNLTTRRPPFDIVRVVPQIVKPSFMHHTFLYQCSGDPRPDPTKPWGSDAANDAFECAMAPERAMTCLWMSAWATGLGPRTFPNETGLRVLEEAAWILMEVHFYNPELREDAVEHSAFDFVLAPTLQPMLTGVFSIGVEWTMKLEPGKREEMFGAVCPAEQVGRLFSPGVEEVAVFDLLPHMHARGRKVRLYAIRGGERIPLFVQDHFDYAFQADMAANFSLRRGDALEVYCGYDTRGAQRAIRWGDVSEAEMCMTTLSYFPSPDGARRLVMSYTADQPLERRRNTWSILREYGVEGVDPPPFPYGPFNAMLTGCKRPPAVCDAALWNNVCWKAAICFQEEVCMVSGCGPVGEIEKISGLCSQVVDMCRPCYTPGEGECEGCKDVCGEMLENG
eukprot:Hpha_TRINITY_DN16975_c2_g1::TRINITY_DN16975_c2_g1_i1::g.54385::m.54385